MKPKSNIRQRSRPPQAPVPRFLFAFLLADAAAFCVIFFQGVEAALFISEGVYPWFSGLILCAFWTLALLGLCLANTRFYPDWPRWKRILAVGAETAGFILVLYGAWRFAATPPRKNFDTLWIANQWQMLPANFRLMARLSPGWAALEVLGAAALTYLFAVRRLRGLTLLILAGLGALVYRQILDFPYGDKVINYLVFFLGPVLVAAAAALARKPRVFARTLAGYALLLLVFWTYAGLIPTAPPSGFGARHGVTRLYPAPGRDPEFPVSFMRDIELDPVHNALYTTYGPACGVVKIDLATARAQVIEQLGLIRFLRTNPEENFIYGTNWDYTEMAVITKQPFKIVRSQDLFKGEVLVVWDHILDGRNHFVGTTEYAGLAKYVRDKPGGPLRKVAFLNFHKLGLMKFKSGAFGIARDPATRRLFIEAGMLDPSDRYMVLAIDPDTMKILHTQILPEGGLELTFVPAHNTLIAASFFSSNLYELDARTLAVRRTFKGPLNSRNVVYDPSRDLIYALGFLEGALYVIRYSDMKILMRVPVGRRANALALWPERDTLFVGGSEGLFRVSLASFLSPAGAGFAPAGNPR